MVKIRPTSGCNPREMAEKWYQALKIEINKE